MLFALNQEIRLQAWTRNTVRIFFLLDNSYCAGYLSIGMGSTCEQVIIMIVTELWFISDWAKANTQSSYTWRELQVSCYEIV